jgi:hypothetical protein
MKTADIIKALNAKMAENGAAPKQADSETKDPGTTKKVLIPKSFENAASVAQSGAAPKQVSSGTKASATPKKMFVPKPSASDSDKPTNYRTNRFHLFDSDLPIAGMQGAHNTPDPQATLRYLAEQERRVVLIGLHEKNFEDIARRGGIEYHWIPIPDFADEGPIPPETYDRIYQVVKVADNEGKQVTIHCGSGDGRTGTAQASLKLRELMEKAAKEDPLILDERPTNTTTVLLKGIVDIPCTPFVKEAIETIRTDRSTLTDPKAGRRSVESENDIATLINYETHLRDVIKAELSAHVSSSP